MIILPVTENGKLIDGMSNYDSLSENSKAHVDSFLDSMLYFAIFGDDGISDVTIPSKSVRDFCKETGRVFSPKEIATLISLNPLLTFEELNLFLRSIKSIADSDEYTNDENKILSTQIEEKLKYHKTLEEGFLRNNDNSVYSYRIRAQDWNKEVIGHFSTFEKAQQAAIDFISKNFSESEHSEKPTYSIIKYFIDSDIEIAFNFNNKNERTSYYTSNISGTEYELKIDYNTNFAFQYVEVPFPFRRGDFVHTIDSPKEEIGIFTGPANQEEYETHWEFLRKLQNENSLDDSDISLRAEYYNEETKTFSHSHPFIPTLEIVELPEDFKHKTIFEAVQNLIKGKGSIETLQYLIKEKS